jgi:hypothetical protein
VFFSKNINNTLFSWEPNNLDGIKIVKAAPDHRFPVPRSGFAALETFSWPAAVAHKDSARSPRLMEIMRVFDSHLKSTR